MEEIPDCDVEGDLKCVRRRWPGSYRCCECEVNKNAITLVKVIYLKELHLLVMPISNAGYCGYVA